MAVIGVGAENPINEVTQSQMGSYASSNEAIWCIFSFLLPPLNSQFKKVQTLNIWV